MIAARSTPAVTRAFDDMNVCPPSRPRVGAVNYLNSKPLVEGLADRLPAGCLTLDFPSRLAASLASGGLDVALIPSVEILRAEGDYEIVSDACVAANGPVRSVKVYFRRSPGDVRTLALDEGSRTSAALAQVMLLHKYGVQPQSQGLPLSGGRSETAGPKAAERAVSATSADAILLIGDRAMYPVDEPFVAVWDLGEEWLNWTGLPFVFAAWAARRDAVPTGLAGLLSETRDTGVTVAESIARREAVRLGLESDVAIDYLTKNLHFTLGSAERAGLKLFSQLASEAGLAPGGIELVFRDRTDDLPAHDAARRQPPPGVAKARCRDFVPAR